MKKFLLAAAAIAAGVTMADPITSANVVGYAQNALQDGATIVASQFVGIGTEGGVIDLQSVKAIGDGCSDNVFVSKLTSTGSIAEQYTWIDWDGEGWVDESYTMVKDVVIQPGEGLWIQAVSNSQGVQTSGQVSQNDVVVQLQDGATAVGNATPVSINLQDIVCSGDGCSDNVFVSKLTSTGSIAEQYTWIDWDGEGWVDESYMMVDDVVIQPGEGLWIQANSNSQIVTLPGVEL